MALDPAGCAAKIGALLPNLGNIDFPAEFAAAYDAYGKEGLVIGAVNTGGDVGALEGALRSVTSATSSIDAMAQGYADYWAAVALVGDGSHGGAPVSVVNDAAAKVSAFKGAIQASIGDVAKEPLYLEFITNIESVVKSLVWTVIEAMPPLAVPTPFPEPIA